MKTNVVEIVRPYIEKIVQDNDLNLYDIEYVKEEGTWFLRVSIERHDKTMDFELAEIICNLISAKLDEIDPIDHAYVLDVCSPGIERPLRNIDEYKENIGQYITVYLKEKDELNNDKYTGDLVAVNDDNIELSYKDKTRVKKVIINFKQIDKAHLAVKF